MHNATFDKIDPKLLRKYASAGGRAAHRLGKAHQFTPEKARIAGSKGGAKVSQDREHMSRIGRLAGLASAASRRAKALAASKADPKG